MRMVRGVALLWLASYAYAQPHRSELSCQADVFVPDSLKQQRAVLSPDGRFRAVLHGYDESKDSESGKLSVFQGKRLLGRYDLHDLSAGIFVKWSPDSRAFYIMWSNAGMIGGYGFRVFRVSPNEVIEVFPTGLAEKEFRSKHDCETRGINLFAIRWMNGSEAVEIAAQVYPTSDCGKQMGVARGYEVRLEDGTILERYSQSAIEKEMKQCPSPIWPTAFWDDRDLQQAKAKVKQMGAHR